MSKQSKRVEIPCEQYGCEPTCLDRHFKPMGEVTEEGRRELYDEVRSCFDNMLTFTEIARAIADRLIAQGWRKTLGSVD